MFRLLRYFSIASLISMMVAAIVLGSIHWFLDKNHMLELGESRNIALTRAFTSVVWAPFKDFGNKAVQLNADQLRSHPDMARLDRTVREAMHSTTVVKLKVIQLDGHVFYSSDPADIGIDYSSMPGFVTARDGGVFSEITHHDTFNAIDGEMLNRDTLSSFIGLRRSESDPVEGVVQIYSDVSDALATEQMEQHQIAYSFIGVMVGLYGILFFIVKRADSIIRRQHEQQRLTDQRLKHATTYDALTDLPNRALLADRIKQSLAAVERHSSLLAVAYIDLDNFKNINSTLGREAGDKVLQIMAKRLTSCLREGDTIARLAADEFVVSLPDIRSSVNLFQIAKKMLATIAMPIEIEGRELHITASIGVALYPEHGKETDALMNNAELAMHSAKQQGGSRHQMFVEHMSVQVQQQVQLEDEMWRALGSNEFVLYYQPVIDLKTGMIVGAEALLRWPNTHGTWLPPSEFIPLSEKCGLIAPLSEWVLTEACTQLQAWHEGGHNLSNFTMAVNLSQRHFATSGLATIIADVIEHTEIDPRWLHLDISEDLLKGMNESILTNFEGIKRTGIKFSLDDFGTGFSSLGHLRNYPIDLLKISRSFIAGLPEDADQDAIVKTIIELANTLNLTVVAKGIETDAQVAFLQEIGCHQAQGFLFSRPLPPDEFLTLVLQRRDMRVTQSVIRFDENEQAESKPKRRSKTNSSQAESKPADAPKSKQKSSGASTPIKSRTRSKARTKSDTVT